MPFHKNVFINCPFDADYLSLLRPLLFTVIDLGFVPKIALESPDSGRPRIDRIIALVQQSKFAIHDLSRLQASKEGELSAEYAIRTGHRYWLQTIQEGPMGREAMSHP
jgi:hypothetical protein